MVNKTHLRSYVPLLISLLFGVILFFLVDDFVVNVVVRPLLWLSWFFSLVVGSIPQAVLWLGSILLLVVITIFALRRKRQTPPAYPMRPTRNTGTVERWARLISFSRRSRYSKWRLAGQLKRLNQQLLAHSDRETENTPAEVDLPPEIKAYFSAQQPSGRSISDWFQQPGDGAGSELDLDPEIVIQYLERRFHP